MIIPSRSPAAPQAAPTMVMMSVVEVGAGVFIVLVTLAVCRKFPLASGKVGAFAGVGVCASVLTSRFAEPSALFPKSAAAPGRNGCFTFATALVGRGSSRKPKVVASVVRFSWRVKRAASAGVGVTSAPLPSVSIFRNAGAAPASSFVHWSPEHLHLRSSSFNLQLQTLLALTLKVYEREKVISFQTKHFAINLRNGCCKWDWRLLSKAYTSPEKVYDFLNFWTDLMVQCACSIRARTHRVFVMTRMTSCRTRMVTVSFAIMSYHFA